MAYKGKARLGELKLHGQFSKFGSPFRVLFVKVPYYIGVPKRDPTLENYPHVQSEAEVMLRMAMMVTIF